jgi:NAD(P)-dependent dehydrogenase (short-subunit alcohol dehydrogenase family)
MNKNTLITGGARGIGLAVAKRLGANGASILLTDRSASDLDSALKELRGLGIDAREHMGDVTNACDMQAAVSRTAVGGTLDLLVHCAGVSPTMVDGVEILRVNLGGTSCVLEAVDPFLREGSSVVLIGSTSAALAGASFDEAIGDPRQPEVFQRLAPHLQHAGLAYGISKRAVVRLAQVLAFPLGRRGIRINTVSPGLADTVMGRQEEAGTPIIPEMQAQIPFPRMVRPEEIAAAVAFLASPDAGFITGTDLLVDGGCVATLGSGWASR